MSKEEKEGYHIVQGATIQQQIKLNLESMKGFNKERFAKKFKGKVDVDKEWPLIKAKLDKIK